MLTVCRLADLSVGFIHRASFLPRFYHAFLCDAPPDITLSVTDEEIEREALCEGAPMGEERFGYLEAVALYRKLCLALPRFGGFMLHASFFTLRGVGVAISAESGVGKTTATKHIKAAYPDEFRIINGDKPLFRRSECGFIGYGTPFCGKERLGSKDASPINALCFLERGEKDEVLPLSEGEAFPKLYGAILAPRDPALFPLLLEEINRFLTSVKLYRLIATDSEGVACALLKKTTEDSLV